MYGVNNTLLFYLQSLMVRTYFIYVGRIYVYRIIFAQLPSGLPSVPGTQNIKPRTENDGSTKIIKVAPERIGWFKEGQAFSRSYALAPRPLPSIVSKLGRRLNRKTGEGGGGGRGAESYDRKKAWPSVSHSVLSGWPCSLYSCLYLSNSSVHQRHESFTILV